MFTHKDLIYHRGRHGQIDSTLFIPENTIGSFVEALRENATMVELDTRKGSDPKNPVIAHDPGNSGAPTLRDALDILYGNMAVNIEIKDPDIKDDVIRIVDEAICSGIWRVEQFIISSFHHDTVAYVKKLRPQWKVAANMDGVPLLCYLDDLADHHVDNVHMAYMNADMDTQNLSVFIKRAEHLGIHVWVWTVNDPAIAQRVYNWGAERIFTDRPDLFAK